jgi:hypothetical protein
LSGTAGGAALALELDPPGSLPPAGAAEEASDARRAAQLLMHGGIDRAVEGLRRHPHDTVAVDLPLRAKHAANELLLLDRLQVHLFDDQGRLLYAGVSGSESPGLLGTTGEDAPAPSAMGYQTIRVPAQAYQRTAAVPGRLQLEYFVTRLKLSAEHRLAADNGRLQAPDIGLCGTLADRNSVSVHCKTTGQAPFCYSATLYAADGRHGPEVFKCDPDYRRHWPALVDVLNFYGMDVPLRDRYRTGYYAVDPSALSTSFVLLKVYAELDHFERTISVAPFQPQIWRARAP